MATKLLTREELEASIADKVKRALGKKAKGQNPFAPGTVVNRDPLKTEPDEAPEVDRSGMTPADLRERIEELLEEGQTIRTTIHAMRGQSAHKKRRELPLLRKQHTDNLREIALLRTRLTELTEGNRP